MSTRSIFTFKDNFGTPTLHVYMHSDGYPTGAAQALQAVIEQGKSWGLQRYEADDFAAGFVAANKTGGGNIRLAASRRTAADVQYGYTVFQKKGSAEPMLTVAAIDGWQGWKESKLWEGRLRDFTCEVAEAIEAE